MDKNDLYISKANFVQFRTDSIMDVYDFQKVYSILLRKSAEGPTVWSTKLVRKNVHKADGEL